MGNNSDAHNKIRDKAFDFKNIPATTGIYQIHPYPAMFHYMLVRKVISEYSREGDYVIDPFMGSGVAGTESLLLNRNFFGCDINPLAAEIARVRTTPLETKQVNAKEGYVPQVKNLRYWFDEVTIQNLSRLHTAISQVGDKDIARFFWIAFSEVVRETSLADKNEFKLVRRKTQASCDVWEVFEKIVHKNIEAIRTLDICKESQAQISIVEGNVFDVLKTLPHERFDLLITSPPYGDSKTTVAYGQFSRLSLWWMRHGNVNLDTISLGGKRKEIHTHLPSPSLL